MRLTFVNTPLQVLQVPQLLVSRCPSLQTRNLVSELLVDIRPFRKLEKHIAQQTCCCITSSQQNIDEFLSYPRLIRSLLDHLLDKEVFV